MMTRGAAQFLSKVKADILSATRRQGHRIVEAIKQDVPVATGTLQAATRSEVKDLGSTVRLVVENDCPYAAYVEYGHVARGEERVTHVPPRPFMRTSYYEESQNYVREIRGQLR